MTMQRRHFELIAETIRDTRPEFQSGGHGADATEGAREQWRDTARAFAGRLAASNPRFDRARFLRACGVEG